MLNLEHVSASPRGLVKIQTAGPHPRVSDSAGLERRMRICISNNLAGDADAAGLEITCVIFWDWS